MPPCALPATWRVWFFRRALLLAPARLGASRIGDLLARLMSDIAEVDGLVVRALAPLLALVVVGVCGVAAAAWIYLPAALVLAVLALAVGVLVPSQVAWGARRREARRARQRMALRTLAFEGLEGGRRPGRGRGHRQLDLTCRTGGGRGGRERPPAPTTPGRRAAAARRLRGRWVGRHALAGAGGGGGAVRWRRNWRRHWCS